MLIKVIRDRRLIKSIDKSKLVLVDVQVNGKNGAYQSKRWKSPNKALDIAKESIKRQANFTGDISFKDKNKGKKVTDKEVLEGYLKSNSNKKISLQNYIANNFSIVKEEKADVKDKVKKVFRKLSPSKFANSVKEAKKTVNPLKAWRVTAYEKDHYLDTQNYATKGGSTVAITSDGDIISVCKRVGDTESGKDLMKFAVKQGGKKLDSFAGNHSFYQKCGFEAVSWCYWDDKEAPPDWNENRDERENIIFYIYTGNFNDNPEKEDELFKRIKPSKDYKEAMDYRDDLVKKEN